MSNASTHAPTESTELRKQLHELLVDGQAHITFEDAVADFPAELRGTVPANLLHSVWQVLEHLRITQRDILNFSAPPTGGYQPIAWPDDYWPASPEPPSSQAWDQAIAAIQADRAAFEALLKPEADLDLPPFSHPVITGVSQFCFGFETISSPPRLCGCGKRCLLSTSA